MLEMETVQKVWLKDAQRLNLSDKSAPTAATLRTSSSNRATAVTREESLDPDSSLRNTAIDQIGQLINACYMRVCGTSTSAYMPLSNDFNVSL